MIEIENNKIWESKLKKIKIPRFFRKLRSINYKKFVIYQKYFKIFHLILHIPGFFKFSSILNNLLYFATRSDLANDPVFI